MTAQADRFRLQKLYDVKEIRRSWKEERPLMFGNPTWFRKKTVGWGLVPVSWQGWTYSAAWSAFIGTPFLTLVSHGKGLESAVWLAFSIGTLVWDVRQIRREMSDDEVEFVMDDRPQEVATRNYDLQLRD